MISSTRDNDDEYEEAVFLVELQGLFEKSIIERDVDQGRCRISLTNNEQPLIQIGANLFVGHWEPTIGTDLLFREIPHRQMLSFVGISEKRLIAQRVFLNPKKRHADEEGEEEIEEEIPEQSNATMDKDNTVSDVRS